MENTPILQHKIYMENFKSREKSRPLSKDNHRKNIHYVKNYYNHTLINKFLSPKPQIHNFEKYFLTKQTRNTHLKSQMLLQYNYMLKNISPS